MSKREDEGMSIKVKNVKKEMILSIANAFCSTWHNNFLRRRENETKISLSKARGPETRFMLYLTWKMLLTDMGRGVKIYFERCGSWPIFTI